MDEFSRSELVMDFPCAFPIKVVGQAGNALTERILEIAQRHDPEFVFDVNVRRNESRTGKYHSFTLAITATSREQLDAIYRDLRDCELVLWAI
ncbi:MAG: hypothetical protein CR991_02320 [Proteobacteria bacterium]|nr:MAG: hypothetical protein CR991_02320 [Pseudomonadota bacterium]